MNKTTVLIDVGGKTIEIERRGDKFVKPKELSTLAGYGSALKPAFEPVLLFRKPRRATYAQTALQHGTGCLNIDGCRIETNGKDAERHRAEWDRTQSKAAEEGRNAMNGGLAAIDLRSFAKDGRWPANVVLDDEAGRLLDAQSGELHAPHSNGSNGVQRATWAKAQPQTRGYTDTGGASRFFYCAKSSRAEREAGLEGLPLRDASIGDNRPSGSMSQRIHKDEGRPDTVARNNHPCVKPLALTEYLARLIVPPVEYRDDARLLVPFCGSGSEILGALRAGWLHVDGIDNEASYIEIAERRIAHELSKLEQSEQQLRLI